MKLPVAVLLGVGERAPLGEEVAEAAAEAEGSPEGVAAPAGEGVAGRLALALVLGHCVAA